VLALSALSDRMVAVIREKEGLAYRLGAGARALPSGGWLISASVGTRPQNEARVRQLWDELTTALGAAPLAPAELERLAARARQKDMLGGLSAGQRASRLARLVFEGKGSPLAAGYADVRNVTPAQLQAAAAKWLAPAGWLATP
jgi:predicted Zn-dependent peptidase